jgi:hypothetical protein
VPGRRASLEEFIASPVGRYVTGRTFAHFCASPALFGTILVGIPDGTDMRALGLAHDADVWRGTRHLSFFDASRLEAITVGAYEALNRAWFERQVPLNRLTQRQAIAQPQGVAGATLARYRPFSPLRFPTRMFDTPGTALAWLGQPHLEGPLAAIAAELLQKGEGKGEGEGAGAGSTFRTEVIQARMEAAKKLLVDSDLTLAAIALEVGCASSQHFSAQFRRLTGSTPSAWRARARGGGT